MTFVPYTRLILVSMWQNESNQDENGHQNMGKILTAHGKNERKMYGNVYRFCVHMYGL